MNRSLIATAWVFVVCVNTIGTAAESDPEGTWRIESSFGNQSRITMLVLKLGDDGLSGELFRRPGEGTRIEGTQIRDGQLTFHMSRTWNGQTFTTHYRGVIRGDTIEGQAEFRRGERARSWEWTAHRSDPSLLTPGEEAPPVAADIDLTDENYEAWRDHILPELSEMAWAEIPWLSTFKDGVLAADAADKPLLLWTMNGHPLGCT